MTKTTTTSIFFIAAVGGVFPGCVADEGDDKPETSDVKGGADGKAEAWGSSDNPALFNQNLEYTLSALPRNGSATNSPWAGNYWPVADDSINYKWDGASSESPSTKYGRAFGVTGIEDAVSRAHGIDAHSSRTSCTSDSQCKSTLGEKCAKRPGQASGRCIPTWWGICHAWAPASILLPEPKVPVTHNGVTFKVQDIKALVTLAYDRTNTRFVSLRCDALDSESEISFDKYGRPTGGDASCRDTNPGTYHVLLANYLGKQGESFVEDRTFDAEVWNQPLRAYRVTEMAEISAVDANKAIGVATEGGTTTTRTGTVAKSAWSHLGGFSVTGGQAVTVAMTGSGDADLYVKFGSQPTTSSYDCRPYDSSSNETCNLTAPSGATQVFVSILGYADSSNYSVGVTAGGSIPTTYAFNDRAAKLYKVHTDVDYISESSASTDGFLGGNIDRYTHTDRYDYILEVDAAGKIIGGEWLGNSKRNHPDFVWLPISVGGQSVAGGKMTYANIKMLHEMSLGGGGGGGGGGGSDKVVNEAGSVTKGTWKHYGPFNVASGNLTATLTGDNDADLYVRKTAAPTAASYDCRPYRDGSAEECTVVGAGTYYVSVNGYAPSSNFSLSVKYKEGSGTPPTPPTPPPSVVHLDTNGSVATGESKAFTVNVTAGKKIVVRTFAQQDVDLYIQMGQAPTTSAYLMRAYTASGNETISYTPSSNGTLHIMVHGYEGGSFTVRTADQ